MGVALDTVTAWLQAQPVWLSFTILVGGSLVAARLVALFGELVIRRFVRSTETEFDELLFQQLRWPVTLTVALAGFYLAGVWLTVAEATNFYLQSGTLTVVVLVWAWGLARLGDRTIELIDEDSEIHDFAPIFENLWTFTMLLGALFVVLSLWDVDITPLLASAGIAGIAIGFAAKDTVANFFGSIALYADDTYTVGDYVELDSGEAGTVVDISIRSTRLITRDNVVVTVPNAVLNSARIMNQSAPRPHKRVRVSVGVAYGSDLDEVESLMLAAAAEEDLVVANPEPAVRFRRFSDSALEYEMLCWVDAPTVEGRAIHRLNRAIYEKFRAAGVEIPYPRRVVSVEDGRDGSGPDGQPLQSIESADLEN